MATKWLEDGSGCYKFDGNSCECFPTETVDNKYNCMFMDPVDYGKVTWNFSILRGSYVCCGVTSTEKFKKGWAGKSMSYCGNISDGSALLISNFGPTSSAGDVVGVTVDCSPSHLTVGFSHNGKFLGDAFNIPAPYPKPLFPVVGFGPSGGQVRIERSMGANNGIPTLLPAHPNDNKVSDIVGDWKLLTLNGAAINENVTLSLKSTDGQNYQISVKAINNISGTISRQGPVWVSSPMQSTMMAGPPEFMALEGQISGAISQVTEMRLDGSYLMIIGQNHAVIMKFAPIVGRHIGAITHSVI